MKKSKVFDVCEQQIKRNNKVVTRHIFDILAKTVKDRKVAERERWEINNTLKRARFRAELDKLGIITCLPFDLEFYEELTDIIELRELVLYKRYKY